MKISVVSGGFDPIHSGHISYINAAKKYGDYLIIALNSDEWLKKKKGKEFMPFEERKSILENIKNVDEIKHKLKSYLHHREFDVNPLSTEEITQIVNNKIAIYDLRVDKKVTKIGMGSKLEKLNISKLPLYIQKNQKKYKDWLD